MAHKIHHKETQRFRAWEIISLLALLIVLTLYRLYTTIGQTGVEQELFLLKASLILVTLGGLLTFLLSIRLVLKVDGNQIKYQYYPLHYRKQKIAWEDVEDYEVVDLPFTAQLNGWALHYGERIFSANRRAGLRLYLRDGQRLFISCKNPEALRKVLQQRQEAQNLKVETEA